MWRGDMFGHQEAAVRPEQAGQALKALGLCWAQLIGLQRCDVLIQPDQLLTCRLSTTFELPLELTMLAG